MNQKNWAEMPSSEIIQELDKRIVSYDKYLQQSGLLNELRDSYKSFLGDSQVRDAGSQGELKAVRINHYASLIRNLVSLVTNNRPAFQPISSNTDAASQGATILATGLLDFYMRDRRLERYFKNACLQACYLRESWMAVTWDTQQGEVIHAGDEENAPIREGDLQFQGFTLVDVIRDHNRMDQNHTWIITREFKNKFDLISQFPERENDIESASLEKSHTRIRVMLDTKSESDDIPFYTFYHKPSACVPQGRMVTFVKGQVLTDGPLPYDKIPLVKLSAEDSVDSCFGHSPMMDVLGPQKVIDTLASTLLSNNSATGVQQILMPKGSGITARKLSGGMNLIEYDPKSGKPEALQLTASAPETYKFFDMMVQQTQLLSGVNSAIRGSETSGMSGAALALLSNNALQYSNSLQQGYTALIEDVGSLAISILQRYANTKRVAILTGKHNQSLLKEWSSADLNGISRVTIDSGNALSKTASGRLTIADSLLQAGHIKRPEEYIQVLTTGQLESVYEQEQAQLMLIRKENEALREGAAVRAILTDDHAQHVLEHASVLSNPEVRQDPNSPIVANTLAHIQEHLDIAQNMPPALTQLLKQQPLPPPAAPQGMPQQAANAPQMMDGTNSIETEAGAVAGPQFPKIAGTNERFTPGEQS